MSSISPFRNSVQSNTFPSFLGYNFPFTPGSISACDANNQRILFGGGNLFLRQIELVDNLPVFKAIGLEIEPFGGVRAVAALENRILIGVDNSGIYYSDDNGASFTLSSNTSLVNCNGFAHNGNTVVAKINASNTHLVSLDNGQSFNSSTTTPTDLFFSQESLKYHEGLGYVACGNNNGRIFVSTDLVNWSDNNLNQDQIWTSEFLNNNLYLGAQSGDVIVTSDNGENFDIVQTEVNRLSSTGISLFIKSMGKLNNSIYIGGSSGDKPILMVIEQDKGICSLVGQNPSVNSPASSADFMVPFNGKMYTNVGGGLLRT